MALPFEGPWTAVVCVGAKVGSVLQMHLQHVDEGGLHTGERQTANFTSNPSLSLVRITVYLDDDQLFSPVADSFLRAPVDHDQARQTLLRLRGVEVVAAAPA